MLNSIKRWLGLEATESQTGTGAGNPRRPTSATAHVLTHGPRARNKKTATEDSTAAGEFDPYNTGKFDRSASWERISRSQR
jgi:hypothetical protein